jgi:hypothetical protein
MPPRPPLAFLPDIMFTPGMGMRTTAGGSHEDRAIVIDDDDDVVDAMQIDASSTRPGGESWYYFHVMQSILSYFHLESI